MGIDSVVCAINTITGIIEQQAFMDEMATVLPIGQGNISIAEVPISQFEVPRGDTRLLAGDILVLISSTENQISAIRELTGR